MRIIHVYNKKGVSDTHGQRKTEHHGHIRHQRTFKAICVRASHIHLTGYHGLDMEPEGKEWTDPWTAAYGDQIDLYYRLFTSSWIPQPPSAGGCGSSICICEDKRNTRVLSSWRGTEGLSPPPYHLLPFPWSSHLRKNKYDRAPAPAGGAHRTWSIFDPIFLGLRSSPSTPRSMFSPRLWLERAYCILMKGIAGMVEDRSVYGAFYLPSYKDPPYLHMPHLNVIYQNCHTSNAMQWEYRYIYT